MKGLPAPLDARCTYFVLPSAAGNLTRTHEVVELNYGTTTASKQNERRPDDEKSAAGAACDRRPIRNKTHMLRCWPVSEPYMPNIHTPRPDRRYTSMTIDRFEARCERAHELLAEAAALLLRHAEPPTSRSGSYSGGSSSSDGESRSPLQTAVQGFETAITLAPHLRPVAVRAPTSDRAFGGRRVWHLADRRPLRFGSL